MRRCSISWGWQFASPCHWDFFYPGYIYIRLFFLDVAVRWELAVGVIDSNKHFLRQVSAILSGGLSTKVLKPVVIVCWFLMLTFTLTFSFNMLAPGSGPISLWTYGRCPSQAFCQLKVFDGQCRHCRGRTRKKSARATIVAKNLKELGKHRGFIRFLGRTIVLLLVPRCTLLQDSPNVETPSATSCSGEAPVHAVLISAVFVRPTFRKRARNSARRNSSSDPKELYWLLSLQVWCLSKSLTFGDVWNPLWDESSQMLELAELSAPRLNVVQFWGSSFLEEENGPSEKNRVAWTFNL